MFNIKALILLVLAVVIGGGAAVFAQRWLAQQQGTSIVEGTDTVNVIVAAREIPYGQPIEEMHLRAVSWPADAIPEDSFSTKEELLGKLVTQKTLPGEPLLGARVVVKLEGSRLSALIAPNKRAITVRVNDVAGVAGFLLPGNRVDIIATRLVDRRAKTSTLLQNIKVLAIDQKASPDKDDPVVVRAVTLEADLEEASKLVGATEEGTIQLILRNPEDNATVMDDIPVVVARVVPKRRKTTREITIIRGTTADQSKVAL